MEKFVHTENLKHSCKVLSETSEESKIMQLLELIRIEMVQDQSKKSKQNFGKTPRPM
jgi:hypothetical protein